MLNPECSLEQLESVWLSIKEEFKLSLGEIQVKSWIEPIKIEGFNENNEIVLLVPTRFILKWVKRHYTDQISEGFNRKIENYQGISFIVRSADNLKTRIATTNKQAKAVSSRDNMGKASPQGSLFPQSDRKESSGKAKGFRNKRVQAKEAGSLKKDINYSINNRREISPADMGLDLRFTFDNFVVGKPNEFAYAAARRCSSVEIPSFNPLFFYGGVGLGKTHLMHAIAHEYLNNFSDKKVLYLSAERFMYRFIQSLREQKIVDFKESFRNVDMLLIDDVQFIASKNSTQEEFFHTFNELINHNKQIVISADKSPTELSGIEDRLKSRLNYGIVADLHATTFELRLAILEAKAQNELVLVPYKVLEFLAHNISGSVRELEGALRRIVMRAELMGGEIDVDTTKDVLQDLLLFSNRVVTISTIQRKVSDHYRIKLSDMLSQRRSQNIARPRQVAMYLCKQLTDKSMTVIGQEFNGKDHTTVLHAIKRVKKLMKEDEIIAEDVRILQSILAE